MARFIQRVIGASVLDASAYEDVERDPSSTTQAAAVVVLSAVATGIGARGLGSGTSGSTTMIAAVALITWMLWAVLALEIGGHLLPERNTQVDIGQLLRTIGFSAAPGVLRIAGVIPAFAMPMFILSTVWMLAAMVVAVRQALDYESTWRAILVCAIGGGLVLAMVAAFGLWIMPPVAT